MNNVTGAYAACVDIGGDNAKEVGVVTNMNVQGEMYCEAIRNHSVFGQAEKINLAGYSQGGLISRYIIQECENITVHNFLSVGGP
eukprot:CAMPEP_0170489410 /NCGR_PEP_ID=MMETSP0208-20121228/7764_1 /TAXON_ID=197538 /ORGANISM="Strombidium inclinatum, Strain S3" /LENGTH=84 /DNA_ID=CAMNT_0010764317 /DNA_START=131 /DNA_END=385 /DNA_ORIENTATION=-